MFSPIREIAVRPANHDPAGVVNSAGGGCVRDLHTQVSMFTGRKAVFQISYRFIEPHRVPSGNRSIPPLLAFWPLAPTPLSLIVLLSPLIKCFRPIVRKGRYFVRRPATRHESRYLPPNGSILLTLSLENGILKIIGVIQVIRAISLFSIVSIKGSIQQRKGNSFVRKEFGDNDRK